MVCLFEAFDHDDEKDDDKFVYRRHRVTTAKVAYVDTFARPHVWIKR